MAYTDNFPQRPAFMADFANGGKIDPRATVSRASTANVFDGSKHESSQNLITNSENFSAWTANNTTPTTNAVAAPDGTTTADTITGNSGTLSKYVLSNSISAAPYPVVSVYVKAGSHNYIQIHNDQSSTHYANFDVTSGAGVVGSVGSNTTSTIQAVGSTGWYRCICRINTASMTSGIKVRLVDSASAAYGASSATTGTVHLWGAMATDIGDLTNIVAYQASTTQIHREYASSLVSKSNNAARFEIGIDGQSGAKGILIEGQSTNLIERSDSIDNAYWVKQNTTVTASAAVGVTGALNACLVTESADSTPTYHDFFSNFVYPTSASSCTVSLYCKSAGVPRVRLLTTAGGNSRNVVFDISNGTVISETSATGTAESVGNGFYRISMTYTAPTTGGGRVYLTLLDASSNDTYTGNGYNSVITSGWQFEMNSFPSSFISSDSGSATTRAADSLSVTDSSLFDNGGGSVVMEIENVGRSIYAAVLEDDSTGNYQDYIALTVRADDKARQSVNAPGSSSQSSLTSAASTIDGAYFKIASRFASNDFGVCIDGGTVATDTTGAVPSNVDKLFIGYYDDGGRANAHIKRVAVFGEPLSDTNLQALTS